MALLRTNVDQTPVAALAASAVSAFPHNLATTPHAVFIRFVQSISVNTSVTNWWGAVASVGPVNVTISNPGTVACPNMEVTSILFHSIIQ